MYFCVASQETCSLHVYSVNGKELASVSLEEQMSALYLGQDHVVLGTTLGNLHIRDLHRCISMVLFNAISRPLKA